MGDVPQAGPDSVDSGSNKPTKPLSREALDAAGLEVITRDSDGHPIIIRDKGAHILIPELPTVIEERHTGPAHLDHSFPPKQK